MTAGSGKSRSPVRLPVIRIHDWIALVTLIFLISGCSTHYTPKPEGYFRIQLPEKKYKSLTDGRFYQFDYPVYGYLVPYRGAYQESDTANWTNIDFPGFNSRLHLTYKPVTTNLGELVQDAHEYVMKHTIKADAIMQTRFDHPEERVFGVLFDIRGNAASAVQFYLTDSVAHFLRGALYFNNEPNYDSLSPVINYLRDDIVKIMETLKWKQSGDDNKHTQ